MLYIEVVVGFIMYYIFNDWFCKIWLVIIWFKFIIWRENRFVCGDININIWLEIILIFVIKRVFSMFILSNGIL